MAKESESQEKSTGSKNILFLVGIALLVLLVAGGVAGAYLLGTVNSEKSDDSSTEEKPSAPAEKKDLGPLVEMEDFVVNIRHNDTSRFLKVGISLEAKDKASKQAIANRMPQIADAVLLMAGNKRFDEIKDLQGKMQLKADLLARIQELSGKGEVVNLFFTDFVVQ
ncbi:MAG: flagellar basal body-associated FliL family protein [Thermodesulfobacteriota bacterium]